MIRTSQSTVPRLLVLVLYVALGLSALDGGAESITLVRPHGENVVFDAQRGAAFLTKAALSEQFSASGITFNLAYDDIDTGFTDPVSGPALRAHLQDVLAYVASIVNYTDRTLDIQVEASEFDGTGSLATAGTFYPGIPGVHAGSTFQRLESGFKPFLLFPEITIMVDLGFAWNVDAGQPEFHEADFFSVLLHEVTHGLGFASVIDPDGSSALGNGNYTAYDQLLFDPVDNQPLLSDSFPPAFQSGATALTGGALEFEGVQAFARYGIEERVPVYSPNPVEPGSSLSHWDVDRLAGGAVMTHAITLGTTQREYSAADLGALEDLGYDNFGGEPGGGCPLAKQGGGATSRADAGALATFAVLGAVFMATPRNNCSSGCTRR